MFESMVINQTPVTEPRFGQIYFDKPKTPQYAELVSSQPQSRSSTSARSIQLRKIATSDDLTLTVADLSQRSAKEAVAVDQGISAHTELDKARNLRVVLLAQKFEGKLNRESGARLAILTQRIERLSPRITEANLNVLSGLIDEMEEVSSGIESLRNEFDF